jgi:protein SCO1/2
MLSPRQPPSKLKQLRLLAWVLVALALLGIAALFIVVRRPARPPETSQTHTIGGAFTLTGADGKAFSSSALAGKPYAIYFGFTRCGDICPTTLQRLVKLRREAASDEALNVVFITIDPKNDGPREVGQYGQLFGAPIIGLTGSLADIERVKKQFGIYAEPVPHAEMGQSIAHTATILLFDRQGRFSGTISKDEPDESAVTTLKQLAGA